jgi:hypothetical protein
MGDFARDCRSKKKGNYKKGKHHASTTEDEESKKRQKGSPSEKEKTKEYYLVSSLSGSLTTGHDTWLVDSGASKHMTWYMDILSYFKKRTFSDQVQLGDDRSYEIKGIGSISFQLESRSIFHVDEILYVPELKKKLLSVAVLEDKGYVVTFMERKALLWPKDGQMSSAEVIGVREGGIYKVLGHSISTLAHDTINSNDLRHRRVDHLHYKALPNLQTMVSGMPSISSNKIEV